MAYTITNAGLTFTQALTFAAPSGTYTLNDALITNGVFTLTAGTFIDGGFSKTSSTFTSGGSIAVTLTCTGIWTLTVGGVANLWNHSNTNSTISMSSSTIIISAVSTGTRTFIGNDKTYGILTYTVAGSTGELDITGSNSFARINFSDASNARSLKFTAATTTTIRNSNGFNVQGLSSKLMTVASITAATHTLSSVQKQVCDYLSLTNSITTGTGGTWYAGANSTDGGGNTGWIFTAAPPSGGSGGSGASGIASLASLQNLRSL